jgi:hypothetical protein
LAEKKKFVLRLDAETLAALEKWAADEFRSINGQLEYLLHKNLKDAGRLKTNSLNKENKEDLKTNKE